MKKKSIILIVCMVCVALFYKYNAKVELVICPADLRYAYDYEKDRIELGPSECKTIIVIKTSDGIAPVRHYRPEATFTHRLHKTEVTWSDPVHISTLMIFDRPDRECGVAVKKDGDAEWRILWFDDNDLRRDVVYLPPYEDLEILKGKRVERLLN